MGLYYNGKPAVRRVMAERIDSQPIPNYLGADEAALRLLDAPIFRNIRRIKVNSNGAQSMLRRFALRRGFEVLLSTPEAQTGFVLLDPTAIPNNAIEEVASSVHLSLLYGKTITLQEALPVELVVVGSVAVTRRGDHCGTGDGVSDLEYAAMLELGHRPVPIVTTVHPDQIVDYFPTYENDLGLSLIATPDELVRVPGPPHPPQGIDRTRLRPEQASLPMLQELASRRGSPNRQGANTVLSTTT